MIFGCEIKSGVFRMSSIMRLLRRSCCCFLRKCRLNSSSIIGVIVLFGLVLFGIDSGRMFSVFSAVHLFYLRDNRIHRLCFESFNIISMIIIRFQESFQVNRLFFEFKNRKKLRMTIIIKFALFFPLSLVYIKLFIFRISIIAIEHFIAKGNK